ncbi:carboxylesterase [Methylobacterium sp. Leaf113]|uniref:carboxylesterase family protein n=1 Tax=Methylobacterium sp. Leaf113 TaxID=1736259 RepID=UPI0006F66830|nr:carboxylesterase family protein [Methylobacterium sp. Leaf113]KQP73104.1 carboxylesterase [Methylobacterium sp. Leaf113]
MSEPCRFFPPCGPVVARVDGAVMRATGIPYAQAARFALPEPVPDWTEPFQATEWAPACPQVAIPFLEEALGGALGTLTQDEACQRLSITCPVDRGAQERLPVMVWIHGGSYICGAGDAPCGDPARLAAEQRVIVVTVTYRLGLFGYLGDDAGRPANLGLLDQIAAFRWVRRNIAAFGGDPEAVTAFGQSAGGDAVAHLMATEEAGTLFRRAIIQSAPLGIRHRRRRMNAAMAQVPVTRAMTTAQVLARQGRVAARARWFGLAGFMPFGTQYGHAPLPPESGMAAAWDRAAPQVDLLIGYTAEEGRFFLPTIPVLQPWLRLPGIGRLLAGGLVGFITRTVYAGAVRRFARRHARAGGRVHRYTLDWRAPGNPFGAAHAIELPLLFGSETVWRDAAYLAGASWPEIDRAGRDLRALWAAFARGQTLPERGRIDGLIRYRKI